MNSGSATPGSHLPTRGGHGRGERAAGHGRASPQQEEAAAGVRVCPGGAGGRWPAGAMRQAPVWSAALERGAQPGTVPTGRRAEDSTVRYSPGPPGGRALDGCSAGPAVWQGGTPRRTGGPERTRWLCRAMGCSVPCGAGEDVLDRRPRVLVPALGRGRPTGRSWPRTVRASCTSGGCALAEGLLASGSGRD